MKFNPEEIFEKYPDIEDIAIRLEQSETDAREKNNKPEPAQNDTSKRMFVHTPEHALISKYYKGGRWEQSPFVPKPGRKSFLDDLAKILETRKPDAIRVEIYKGKTERSGIAYAKELYFKEEQPKNEKEELGAFKAQIEETLEQFKQQPGANNLQIELLRKDFETQLNGQRHSSELRELNLRHQTEIGLLQQAITQRDEYIRELEEELDENEGTLGNLKAESEKEKSTPFGEIVLGRVLMQAGENLLKNNPKILKVGLGLSDADIKKIFEKDGSKELGAPKGDDNSGFSEATQDEFSGLDEKHVQGIKDLFGFFKQITVEEFKKVFTIDCLLQDAQTGMLNIELADKTLSFLNENRTK